MFYKFTPDRPNKDDWACLSKMDEFYWYKGTHNELWCKQGNFYIRLEHGRIAVFHENELDSSYIVIPFEKGTLEVTLKLET